MLGGLQQRITVRADGRGLFAVEKDAHPIKAAAQALAQSIKSFHGKQRVQRLHRGVQRTPASRLTSSRANNDEVTLCRGSTAAK